MFLCRPLNGKEKKFSLCVLCVLSEAGGERYLYKIRYRINELEHLAIGDTFKERTFKMKPYTTFLTILLILFSSVAFAERLAVSSDTANIRSGPGTNHDILWKVEKFHPLFILKKTNVWYHFRDFEKDEGWIHESLVNKTPTVITSSDKCNVRSGPGTKNKILFSVDKGIPFKILKKKGTWIRIQHADGDKGWVHKSLVW